MKALCDLRVLGGLYSSRRLQKSKWKRNLSTAEDSENTENCGLRFVWYSPTPKTLA